MNFINTNEITVQDILNHNNPEITEKMELYSQGYLSMDRYRKKELSHFETLMKYLDIVKSSIIKHKLSNDSKISVSFIPKLELITNDQPSLSKLGGVPFCFLEDLLPHLNNKIKSLELLKNLYPKDSLTQSYYLKYIGDIDSTDMFFMNEVLPKINYEWEKLKSFYRDSGSPVFQIQTLMKGSFFIDGEVLSLGSLTPNGQFFSKRFLETEGVTPEQIKTYVEIITEFIKNEVNPHYESLLNDHPLAEITEWTPHVEVPNPEIQLSGNYLEKDVKKSSIKLFGYAEAQQSRYPCYCPNGMFGPRLLTPFVSFFNHNQDTTIQIYTDLLSTNASQDYRTSHLKIDVSST